MIAYCRKIYIFCLSFSCVLSNELLSVTTSSNIRKYLRNNLLEYPLREVSLRSQASWCGMARIGLDWSMCVLSTLCLFNGGIAPLHFRFFC